MITDLPMQTYSPYVEKHIGITISKLVGVCKMPQGYKSNAGEQDEQSFACSLLKFFQLEPNNHG